ncbi:MAG: hypothetical protein IPL43_10805 [Micropruina sp.]|nr:hypothetical protein [Micropruina sp.]
MTINRCDYFDGGLRSPANADLAIGVDRVLVLAPLTGSARPSRRPRYQLARFDPSVRWLLVTPAGLGPWIMDPAGIGAAVRLGRAQGRRLSHQVADLWG